MASFPKWLHKFELRPGVWVFVPSEESLARGAQIKYLIEKSWGAPSYYYHLRKGGHLAALRAHMDSKFFARMDLQGFFASVNRSKVTRSLKSLVGYQEARDIALDSTVWNPGVHGYALPFGFVQSPILASVCLRSSGLGVLLSRLKKSPDVRVSVYVDDILLSSSHKENVDRSMTLVREAVYKSGFRCNENKEQGPAESINVFNVKLTRGHLEVTDDRMAQFVFDFLKGGEYVRRGIRGYVASINEQQAGRL